MSGHDKMQDALADFHGLIEQGRDANDAIAEAAAFNGIPAENLEARLSHYCDIESLVEESRIRADLNKLKNAIDCAIKSPKFKRKLTNIFEDPFDIDAAQFEVEEKIGRPLSDAEVAGLAKARHEYRLDQFKSNWGFKF